MDSLLEDKRSLHEERDRVELAIVNEMLSKKNGHRERLDSEHRQKILLNRYMNCSKKLAALYEKQFQVPLVGGNVDSNRDPISAAFNAFYMSLRGIKDFYERHSNEQVVTLANEFEELEAVRQIALNPKAKNISDNPNNNNNDGENESYPANHQRNGDYEHDRDGEIQRLTKGLPSTDLVEISENPLAPSSTTPNQIIHKAEKLVDFTDEEGYGRYLDLTECHEAFLQVLKREETKPSYLTFLDKFDQFSCLDRDFKMTLAYKTYVEKLLEYFRSYCRRAKPLVDYTDLEAKAHEKFIEQWNSKTFPGWFTDLDRMEPDEVSQVELEAYKSAEELMELGLECLKKELRVRGLKCGGTLEERAKRLWSIRGKSQDQTDDSIRAAPAINRKGKRRTTIEPFSIASMESKLCMYAEYFSDHRVATIENVQRKQARTAEERNESDEDISDVDDDDEQNDSNDVIYNPKNLPLGWDGKPIPYWLYKLHGLNLTFTCEICGNAIYKGPKTFQRHFAEWRHAHGMRCLGIPNTAHFANITKIQDAISLWDKLKAEKHKDKTQAQNEEEYEDSQGNVVNKKTYEDLKRQGLL